MFEIKVLCDEDTSCVKLGVRAVINKAVLLKGRLDMSS